MWLLCRDFYFYNEAKDNYCKARVKFVNDLEIEIKKAKDQLFRAYGHKAEDLKLTDIREIRCDM